ncbi:MAG: hypothetical protein COV70_01295 [Parcubacteria group bacterium CG11_big_fil_rev_8_21_14_0_20_39_22]|nr:MAG: hypothetical protein COV70_01295 [Parcubacteria group bacterium CG11_big_fil_rev_8_21_14_0_20_39_22]
MYLKSLELIGFKSFGKKTELEFNTPVAAVVGPNGSGKSNISEAMRFVLGEQSMKSLRSKKTEDLIYNGGSSDGRANRASVKLVFDNAKRLFDLDFDEVLVERAVYRDGSSEYKINGSQVRLRDVWELLSQANIGASGHHIISQGEADKILSSSIKDRRTIIEDALGLKIYQYKRAESERKLAKTEGNIEKVESLRREISPHIRFLKKQVEKIEKSQEMKRELSTLYEEYLYRESIYIKEASKRVEEAKKGPASRYSELERKLTEAKTILESAKSKDDKSDELISLERKLSEIRSRKDELSRKQGLIEGEISGLKRFVQKQKEREEREGNQSVPLSQVQSLITSFRRSVEDALIKDSVEAFRQSIVEVKGIFDTFLKKYSETGGEQGSVVSEHKEEIKRLEEQGENFIKELSEIKGEENELVASYNRLRSDIETEKDSSRDAERAIFSIMSEQNDVRSLLKDLSYEEDSIKMAKEAFDNELKEGSVLIGREIVRYEEGKLSTQNGGTLSFEDVMSEDRAIQKEREKSIEKIKIKLEDSGLSGSEEIMKEYKETTERDEFLEKELIDLRSSAESLKNLIGELEVRIDSEFKAGLSKINKEFQNLFSLMFGGGQASLVVIKEESRRRKIETEGIVLDDEEPQIEEEEEAKIGIDIKVSLPRKNTKGLMMLSGGERALTSIALLFAMSQVKPPPFLILDETDAALDEANSKKYADMIENLSKYSQLIVITHNRETMSRAGIIYGVTMDRSGLSKLLSIAFDKAVEVAK